MRRPGFPPSATEPAPEPTRIARIGAEGDGIGQVRDGLPLYLRLVLPGETVLATPRTRRGEGWAGTVDTVLAPSAERVAPVCRHFGGCGGCALQHWDETPYLAWKSDLLAAALRRAGFAEPPILPIRRSLPGTRRRMDLALRRQGGRVQIGLHQPRGREIVDLAECHVLQPALVALIAPLRAALQGLGLLRREGAAVVNLLDSGPDLLLRTDGRAEAADRLRLAGFARLHGLPRISWAGPDGVAETLCELRPAETRLSGVAVRPPPGGFLQATEAGEASIIADVLAGLPDDLPRKARIGELFAGSGTLSFALAARAQLRAFEGDPAAAQALRQAAARAGLAGRLVCETRDLARRPVAAAELGACRAVVLDPPYEGAGPQMAELAASRVGRVVYVSCNPAALAADARLLRQAGYRVLAARPIDQFLWSARLESVVVFAR